VLLIFCVLSVSVSGQQQQHQRLNFRGAGQADRGLALKALEEELAAHGDRIHRLESDLEQLFISLPKNVEGNLGHQAVRYALHRFFLKRHGWFIRGLEPDGAEWSGETDGQLIPPSSSISLKEWVPSFLQDTLEARVGQRGSSLHDLAAVAAAMEDLIQRESKERLSMVYLAHELSTFDSLPRLPVSEVLLTYFMSFLVANNFTVGSYAELMGKRQMFQRAYRNFTEASYWFYDKLESHFQQSDSDEYGQYNFGWASNVVTDIGESFYSFNEKECSALRSALSSVESRKPGRVRLSTFYNMTRYSHWRFTERPEFLRALGSLDDSDPKNPSVIIPNYAMARTNCLDGSHLFAICCRNTCEDMMGDLEKSLGAPSASAEQLATLVANLPSESVEAPRELPPDLVGKLQEISEHHGGAVPIHGRLFAQWMHHAYPLECPYPHEEGINPQTASEWMEGGETEASESEMQKHLDNDMCAVNWQGRADCEEESTELPWIMKERLIAQSSPVSPVFGGDDAGAVAAGAVEVAAGATEEVSGTSVLCLFAVVSFMSSCIYAHRRSSTYPELGVVLGEQMAGVNEVRVAKAVAALSLLALGYCADLLNGAMLFGAVCFATLTSVALAGSAGGGSSCSSKTALRSNTKAL